MPKSLSELRADTRPDGQPRRVERIKSICLAQHLVAEAQRLQAARADAFTAVRTEQEGEAPRSMVRSPAESALNAIDTELAAIGEQMRDATGELLLRGMTGGEWRRWVSEHPARKGNAIDERWGLGVVDADALANDLGKWVVSYNDEPVDADALAFILDSAAAADVNDMVSIVVQMHEISVTIPKSRSASSDSPTSAPASTSPAPSESHRDGSTAGSPPSATSTTTPTAS
ncbi:hypothetical protein INN71_02755 [Nocardioides sp. ChNu-153]|uniref:hypothetical protein n=1 Tax=Nocardioides sp. ChNu-153 TaxID=2779364 RepID=UPI0026553F1A|nr:hypothetical protein [Nocardioides sp. ChNu-153]MDN7120306.1 hypothetical protein [Nocardioides sp. ChNu-153]